MTSTFTETVNASGNYDLKFTKAATSTPCGAGRYASACAPGGVAACTRINYNNCAIPGGAFYLFSVRELIIMITGAVGGPIPTTVTLVPGQAPLLNIQGQNTTQLLMTDSTCARGRITYPLMLAAARAQIYVSSNGTISLSNVPLAGQNRLVLVDSVAAKFTRVAGDFVVGTEDLKRFLQVDLSSGKLSLVVPETPFTVDSVIAGPFIFQLGLYTDGGVFTTVRQTTIPCSVDYVTGARPIGRTASCGGSPLTIGRQLSCQYDPNKLDDFFLSQYRARNGHLPTASAIPPEARAAICQRINPFDTSKGYDKFCASESADLNAFCLGTPQHMMLPACTKYMSAADGTPKSEYTAAMQQFCGISGDSGWNSVTPNSLIANSGRFFTAPDGSVLGQDAVDFARACRCFQGEAEQAALRTAICNKLPGSDCQAVLNGPTQCWIGECKYANVIPRVSSDCSSNLPECIAKIQSAGNQTTITPTATAGRNPNCRGLSTLAPVVAPQTQLSGMWLLMLPLSAIIILLALLLYFHSQS